MKIIKRSVDLEIMVDDTTDEDLATADLEQEVMELCRSMTTNRQLVAQYGTLDNEFDNYRDEQFHSVKVTAIKDARGNVW